jgi:transcriptional regulator with XRE-family HTH domain
MIQNFKELGRRIRSLRTRLGMTQQQLADQLGMSRSAVAAMEGAERKVDALMLQKIAQVLNCSAQDLTGAGQAPEVVLPEDKAAPPVRPKERIHVPQKNFQKFREVLLYILNKVGSKPNIGETVIYKLLYFMDFNFYEKYEEQLIGATYIKNRYGPTPTEFRKIVERMTKDADLERVSSKYFEYPQTKYLPRRAPDLSVLKAHEMQVVDEVLARLSDMNANQISEYSHKDIPWLSTAQGEAIPYESVFYRTAPYSVREYKEHSE